MTEHVHPYEREGAWSSAHSAYYKWAWLEYEEYRNHLTSLIREEMGLRESHKNEDPELLGSLVLHETDTHWHKCYKSAVSAHLFACMAVEGFLNNYGVRRLGEEFYKRRIERLGITEKIAILVLSCHGIVLQENAAILSGSRQLFNFRNNLVHPKTREINFERIGDHVVKHPSEIPIGDNMTLMESVISEFSALDPEIRRDFEFHKPNTAFKTELQVAVRPSAG